MYSGGAIVCAGRAFPMPVRLVDFSLDGSTELF
jgi:hypothetical protein